MKRGKKIQERPFCLPPWGKVVRQHRMRGSRSQNGVAAASTEAEQTDAYASYPSSVAFRDSFRRAY